MTFCNDATSIAPFLHVRDIFVKQLVQILVHGDGLRNTEESLVTAVQETLLSRGKYVLVHKVKHIPIQDAFKPDSFCPQLLSGGFLSAAGFRRSVNLASFTRTLKDA
jgi:hypothetical protein